VLALHARLIDDTQPTPVAVRRREMPPAVDDHVVSVRHQARPDLLVVGLDAAVRSPNAPRPDEGDPEPRRRRGATRPKVAGVSRAGHVLPQSRRFFVVIFSSSTPSPSRERMISSANRTRSVASRLL